MSKEEILARNIREYREKKNISREWLANEAGICVSHLQSIENGKTSITIRTLCRLAAAINVEAA